MKSLLVFDLAHFGVCLSNHNFGDDKLAYSEAKHAVNHGTNADTTQQI